MHCKWSAVATVTLALAGCGEGAPNTSLEVTPVASISFDAVSTQLIPGTQIQLVARAQGPSGEPLSGLRFTYSGDTPAVASVSTTGLVTLIAPGKVTVAASTEGRTATREIIVNYPVPTLTGINPTSVPNGAAVDVFVRGSGFYAATVARLNGVAKPSRLVSDTEVRVTFTAADVAAAGVAAVTVFNPAPGGGTSGAISLNVRPTVASISIDPVAPQLIPGVTVQLSGRVLDLSGELLPGFVFNYAGNNPSVASVSATGLLTSISPGAVTVTAFTGGRSATREIIVNYPVPGVTEITPTSVPIGVAASITVRGTGFYPGTLVRLNGVTKSTTRITDSELRVGFTAVDVATAGASAVTVFNPAPGGGTSASLPLLVLGAAVCDSFEMLTPATPVSGRLDTTDCFSGSPGSVIYNDVYNFTMTTAAAVTFTLASTAFDPFLILRDPTNRAALHATTFTPRLTAAVLRALLPARPFAVSAGSVNQNAVGAYTLASTVTTAPTITRCETWFVVPPLVLNESITQQDCALAPHHRVAPLDSRGTFMHEYYWDEYQLNLLAGQTVTVTAYSPVFGVWIGLYGSNGGLIKEANNGAGGTNAQMTFTADQTGAFEIEVAPSFVAGITGAYTIRIE